MINIKALANVRENRTFYHHKHILPFSKAALGVWIKVLQKPVLFAFGQKNRSAAEYVKHRPFFGERPYKG